MEEGLDFLLRERTIVCKVPELRIREPGRHLARQHGFPDSLGPGPRVRVADKRHGRDLAWTMAFLAPVLEDGKHVFVEGWRRGHAGESRKAGEKTNEPATQRIYRGIAWSKNRKSPLPRFH